MPVTGRITRDQPASEWIEIEVPSIVSEEVFELADINDLPISFDIAWYEQKAVTVLLALLHLGVKGIRLGPAPPAFVTPNVFQLLQERFDLKLIESEPPRELFQLTPA